jgi:hypothetical protein
LTQTSKSNIDLPTIPVKNYLSNNWMPQKDSNLKHSDAISTQPSAFQMPHKVHILKRVSAKVNSEIWVKSESKLVLRDQPQFKLTTFSKFQGAFFKELLVTTSCLQNSYDRIVTFYIKLMTSSLSTRIKILFKLKFGD